MNVTTMLALGFLVVAFLVFFISAARYIFSVKSRGKKRSETRVQHGWTLEHLIAWSRSEHSYGGGNSLKEVSVFLRRFGLKVETTPGGKYIVRVDQAHAANGHSHAGAAMTNLKP